MTGADQLNQQPPDSGAADTPDVGNDTAAIPVVKPRRWPHTPVVVVAVLVGLICGMPHGIMGWRLATEGKAYAPLVAESVAAITLDETVYYAPRVRDVIDGHPLSADPTGLEHKTRTGFLGQGRLDALVLGWLGMLLGRSVPSVFVFCDFVLPPLAFLLLFAVCRRLGAPEWVSIAASLLAVLAPGCLTALLSGSGSPLDFCRLTVPQFAFIPCAAVILGLVNLYDRPRLRRALWTGLMLGLVFYSHAYYWTFLLAAGGLLVLGAIVGRQSRRAVPMLLVALATGVILGLPVLYQSLGSAGFPGREDLAIRQGPGGTVGSGLIPHVVLLLAVLALYPKRRREFIPVAAFALAPFVCMVAAQATGAASQPRQWLSDCWAPWSGIALGLMLWTWVVWAQQKRVERDAETEVSRSMLLRHESGVNIGFAALAVLVLVGAGTAQARFAARMAGSYTMPREQLRALRELDLRAPPGSVVMCLDRSLAALIPVYTHCNVFLPFCATSPLQNRESIDRAGILFATFGVGEREIARFLSHASDPGTGAPRSIAGDFGYWMYYRTRPDGGAPADAVREVQAKARFYGPEALVETELKYQADFVAWGPLARQTGRPELETRSADRLFIDAGGLKVYRAHPTNTSGPEPWPVDFPRIEEDPDGRDAE